MNPLDILPALPPRLPLPGILFGGGEEEEIVHRPSDGEFKRKMESEGFDSELIEMGIKVANNHSRDREDALKIGEKYIREMSK